MKNPCDNNMSPIFRLIVALWVTVFMSGCRSETKSDVDWFWIWREIPWLKAPWQIIVWTVLGGLIGLVSSIILYALFRRLRLYDYPGHLGKWLARIICLWMIVSLTFLFGWAGSFEGMYRSVQVSLIESPIGKEWLPQGSAYGADLFFEVDQRLNKREEKLDRLDLGQFVGQLDQLKDQTITDMSESLIDKALEQNPNWKGSSYESLLRWTINWLSDKLMKQDVEKYLEELGKGTAGEQAIQGLKGKEMNREELGRFLSENMIVPGILVPVRYWIRNVQKSLCLGAFAAVVVPVLLIMLLNRFFGKRKEASKVEGSKGLGLSD